MAVIPTRNGPMPGGLAFFLSAAHAKTLIMSTNVPDINSNRAYSRIAKIQNEFMIYSRSYGYGRIFAVELPSTMDHRRSLV